MGLTSQKYRQHECTDVVCNKFVWYGRVHLADEIIHESNERIVV